MDENEFKPNDVNENSSSVKSVIDRLENARISLETFEEWYAEVITTKKIIEAQIENNFVTFKKQKREAKDLYEEAKEQDRISKDFVPARLNALQNQLYHSQKSILYWYVLLSNIQEIMLEKAKDILLDAKKSAVMRDAIKRSESYIKEQNDFFKEVVTNKMNNMDEKIMGSLEQIQRETNSFHKDNIKVLSDALETFSENNVTGIRKLADMVINMQKPDEIIEEQNKENNQTLEKAKEEYKNNVEEHSNKKLDYPTLEKNQQLPQQEVTEEIEEKDDEEVEF